MKKIKEVILFFGRCNPPTRAHPIIWKNVKEIATERKCDYKIFITHSHDSNRNPVPPKIKLAWCKKIAPDINFTLTGGKTGIRTIIEVVNHLVKKGYTTITIVAGDDRKELEEVVKKYLEQPCEISFISAGSRTEQSHFNYVEESTGKWVSLANVSATKLREFVYSLMQIDEAFEIMPKSLSQKQKVELYYDILFGSGYMSRKNKAIKKYLEGLKDA